MAAKAKPKPKAKAKPAKAVAKKAAPKKAAPAKPKATKGTGRHPGRRPEPQPKVKAKHMKEIKSFNDALVKAEQKQIDDRRKNEEAVQAAKDKLAVAIDAGQKADVSTNDIAELIEKSRQTVFKLVAERVDGKSMNKPRTVRKEKQAAKAAAAQAEKPAPKTKPKAAKKAPVKKAAPKKTVVAGRDTDLAKGSKAKPKKVRPRPKA